MDLQQGTVYRATWRSSGSSTGASRPRWPSWQRSNDVVGRFNQNAGMTPGLDRAGQPLYVAFGKSASIETLAWKGKTRYHGIEVKVDRKFRNGWLVTNSYTYGTSKDYANDNYGPSTPANPEISWGILGRNRKHNYVASFVWSLPGSRKAAPKHPRQLAAVGPVLGDVGRTDGHHDGCRQLAAPGNTQRPNFSGTFAVLDQYGPARSGST